MVRPRRVYSQYGDIRRRCSREAGPESRHIKTTILPTGWHWITVRRVSYKLAVFVLVESAAPLYVRLLMLLSCELKALVAECSRGKVILICEMRTVEIDDSVHL